MSSNRRAWILVSLVVVVVALLVVRTMRNDARLARERTAAASPHEGSTLRPGTERPTSSGKKKDPAERRVSSVERAKMVLKEKGYYNGPIDGNYDGAVADAVKRFQKDQGMEQNGYLNERTYDALGVEVRGKR